MIKITGLVFNHLNKALFNQANLTIHQGSKVGIVGVNGCGKSTLCNLISGKTTLDGGDIILSGSPCISYLQQQIQPQQKNVIDCVLDGDQQFREIEKKILNAKEQHSSDIGKYYEQFEAIGGYHAKARALKIISGLGFASGDELRLVKTLSGGWQMRLNLAQVLMSRADILILDEPTNHLDLDATLWLEKWLQNYQGTLIVISHDREFLDTTTNQTAHIEQQKITLYKGNYSEFEKLHTKKQAVEIKKPSQAATTYQKSRRIYQTF